MNEKRINARFTPKGDIEANWNKAIGFIPLDKEIIIYKPDENNATARIKIGDGITPVQDLPFVSNISNIEKLNIEDGEGALSIQQSLDTKQVDFHNRNTNATAFDEALATVFETGAQGPNSASLNGNTIAIGSRAVALNNKTIAKGDESLAQGYQSVAYGGSSFAGGNKTLAAGSASVSVGSETQALKNYAFAEGKETTADGEAAHAEGYRTQALDSYAHASGNTTVASGESSYAGGAGSTASGRHSFAQGEGVIADGKGQVVVGVSNAIDSAAVFMVGNGEFDDATSTATTRQTAFKVMKDGRAKVQNGWIQEDDDVVTKSALERELTAVDTITYLTLEIPSDNYLVKFYSLPGVTKIDWADGKIDQELSHEYAKAGTYQCKFYDLHTLAFNVFGPEAAGLNVKAIKAIDISPKVQHLSSYAFKDCENLTSIVIPDSVESIGYAAFEDCSKLTSIEIPDSVASIGSYAFDGCTGLTSVVIGDGVTSIGDYAFVGCGSLESVVIGDGIKLIGQSAFYGCRGLRSVVIKSAKIFDNGINRSAFCSINPSAEVIFESPHPIHFSTGGGAIFDQDTITIKVPKGCVDKYKAAWTYNMTTGNLFPAYLLDNIVENTYRNSFEIGSNSLTAGTGAVAKGNNSIASGEMTWATGSNSTAFGHYTVASGFGSHAEGDHTEATKDYAHAEGGYTQALKEYAHAEGKYTEASGIAAHAEGYHTKATGDYTHASGYYTDATRKYQTAIGKFNSNRADTLFEVGNGTSYEEKARSNAFEVLTDGRAKVYTAPEEAEDVVRKKELDILSTKLNGRVTEVTFNITKENTLVNFRNGLPGMTKVNWGDDTIDSLTQHTYKNTGEYICKIYDLTEIVFSYSGPPEADFDRTSITKCIIGDGVTSIGSSAFAYCINLTSIEIPDSVTSIDKYAFSNCRGLTSMEIPDSVTSIGDGVFYNCINLTSIEIPDSVTWIGSEAFAYCDSSTSVVIKNPATSIAASAFTGCNALVKVVAPALDNGRLISSPVLEEATILSNSVSGYSNTTAPKLTTLIIGEAVTSFSAGFCAGCSNLKTVVFKMLKPVTAPGLFASVSLEHIYVPYESFETYLKVFSSSTSTVNWINILKPIERPATVNDIEQFKKNSNLYMFFDGFSFKLPSTSALSSHKRARLVFKAGEGTNSEFWAAFQNCHLTDNLCFDLNYTAEDGWQLSGIKNPVGEYRPGEDPTQIVPPNTVEESVTNVGTTSANFNGPNIVYVLEAKNIIKFFVKPDYKTLSYNPETDNYYINYHVTMPWTQWWVKATRHPENYSSFIITEITIEMFGTDELLQHYNTSNTVVLNEGTQTGDTISYYKYDSLIDTNISGSNAPLVTDDLGYTTQVVDGTFDVTKGIPLLFTI